MQLMKAQREKAEKLRLYDINQKLSKSQRAAARLASIFEWQPTAAAQWHNLIASPMIA